MPWFRVDDTFAHHEKVVAAGNAAIGLWTRAGAWSMQQLTDGFIPEHVAKQLGKPREVRRLVEVGLWFGAEGGYEFYQWFPRQPSKDQLNAARQKAAERQRRGREAQKSRRDSRRDTSVSHGGPIPSHPNKEEKTSSTASPSKSYTDEFEAWWKTYPRRVGKGAAAKAYTKALKLIDREQLTAVTERYVKSVDGSDEKFIPHPATWLNEHRFNDEGLNPETPEQRLRRAWHEGYDKEIGKLGSVHFFVEWPSEIPEGREEREAFKLQSWRQWLEANHDELVDRLRRFS